MKRFLLFVTLLGLCFHANAYHWDVNINTYPNTMSIIGVIAIDGEEQTVNTIEIGAFSGDECRGRGLLTDMYYNMFNHYYVFLTVYGNDGDELSFRLYDHVLGEELDGFCDNTVTFSTNGTLGDPGEPYMFNYANSSGGGYHWDVNIHQYANNMNFCGIIEIDSEEQLTDELEIGAFCGDECRGREKPISQYYSTFNHYFVFLTVYGNDGDQLSFRLYDHSLEQELDLNCTTVASFSTNGTYGDPVTPFVFAFFSQFINYTITATANPTEGGTVSGVGTYQQGQLCILTATPNEGYTFTNWTENDTQVSTDATYSFTVTGNRTLVAHFTSNPTPVMYTISATADPVEGGEVSGAGTYQQDQLCTLTATPNEGYTFTNWTENGTQVSTDATYSFTVTGDRTLVANFEGIPSGPYHWDVNIHQYANNMNFCGIIEIDSEEQLTDELEIGAFCGDECRGREKPISQYYQMFNHYFVFLTVYGNDGDQLSFRLYDHSTGQELDLNCTTVVSFSTNGTYGDPVTPFVFAFFSQTTTYTITATANPTIGGTVTGAGTYNHNATCTLVAANNTGYHFVNWTKNSEVVSTDATYTFTVTENASYVANFEINSYNITASANPTEGGTVTGAGTYDHNATCTLVATNNTGYHFVNWTKNGEVVSTDTSYTFTVTEAAAYVANFELNSYVITVEAYPTNGGTVSGGGTFVYGTSCTLNAVPEEQFAFSNWSKNGQVVSIDTSYTFIVTEEATYVGNFERISVTQTTDIYTGWNWYSTYIEQEGIDGLTMLEESLDSIGKRIKAQSGDYQECFDLFGWMGPLSSITNEDSYLILATGDGVSSMTGPVVHPSDHPITLYPGWNWIGYPCINEMSIDMAFSNLSPTYGDQVKIADNYANYYPGLGPSDWFGFFNTFTPGMGMLYHSNNTEPITFTYPEIERFTPSVKNVTYGNNHWTADRHAYPSNMTVSAVVELGNEELLSENYELAAFANGECRGSAKLTYIEPLNRYMALLVVSGDETTALQFGLYNTETGVEYFDCQTFADYNTNAILGTLMEPFTVRFRNNTGVDELGNRLQVYPNPVGRGETFSLGMAADGEISIEIINTMGAVIRVENATKQLVSITAPSVAGIYTLRIIADGKNVYYKKLIVR